jgi:Tfp pilus assembly protein PilF
MLNSSGHDARCVARAEFHRVQLSGTRTLLALATLALTLVLAGCASAPQSNQSARLLQDDLFVDSKQIIDVGAVFRVSEAMTRYLDGDAAREMRKKGAVQGLYDALYSKHELRLDYDAAETRTASEAFDARSGNCLSLVIMTAAIAKALELNVYFQSVAVDENWLRRDDLYFYSGHVNVTLGRKRPNVRFGYESSNLLTIDFTPLSSDGDLKVRPISEATVLAMYMNNRAAEMLAAGKTRQAYWWVREAILQDAEFLPSYNTLAIVYRRSGYAMHAEAPLRHVLDRDSSNVPALSNTVLVLRDLGKHGESETAAANLKRIVPFEPYHFFRQAQLAMKEKNFRAARDLFAREVNRQPFNHEFHFALAMSHFALGETEKAIRHLSIAGDTSITRQQQGIYAAKLERLRAVSRTQ